MSFTDHEMAHCVKVLQCIADDPSLADKHERFRSLVAKIRSQGRRRSKQVRRSARAKDAAAIQSRLTSSRIVQTEPAISSIESDRALQRQTGIVRQALPTNPPMYDQRKANRLIRPQRCYVCKAPFVDLHFHYHRMCPACAGFNWDKRQQRCDLTGRFAIVTGGRVKIGYIVALKLLRDGARVLVTTRFPGDAIRRFEIEEDFRDWQHRLRICALDFRNLPSVETFADEVQETEGSLEILIHNAAQTIKRPLAFYQHLLQQPRVDTEISGLTIPGQTATALLECAPQYQGHLPGMEQYFPAALLDEHGQQRDLRPENSWKLKLGSIGTIEMLEVLLVNTAAPFVLTSRLLPLLERSTFTRRFVVNVSAMEGQFNRLSKTPDHPHTNMAKAALNMLTRTSAADLATRQIFMNSVDTGWITDEKPAPDAKRVQIEEGFFPPLDIVDGAARIYDPIASGLGSEPPLFGHFLKDYRPYPW